MTKKDAELTRVNFPSHTVGLDSTLSLEYVHLDQDNVRAELLVSAKHLQPAGIVHGGVYCSIVESLGSVAGTLWLAGKGYCVGVNNNTDFLKSVKEGTLSASATPIHRGRLQQLWNIDIKDDQERLCAQGKLRLQNFYAQQ